MSQRVKQLINMASHHTKSEWAIRDALLAIATALNEMNERNELKNELDEFRTVVGEQIEKAVK